jgi:colicin import membrane protein
LIDVKSDARDDLLPPRPEAMRRGLVFALVAHALLVLALTIGVKWHASEPVGSEAELWAAVPQSAAPQAAATEAPAPVAIKPPPKAPPAAKPDPDPEPQPDAQIAIEKEKARKEREKKDAAEHERQEREKQRTRELEQQEEQEREKDKDKKKKEQLQRDQLLEKMKLEKKEQEQERKKEEKRLADEREANMKRMMGQAGSVGGGTGNADKNAGPSAGYSAKIKSVIRPNVILTAEVPGNPVAEAEVRLAPDGAIIGRRIIKSSGVPEWDETVLRAIDRTQRLPRDVDGRVISPTLLRFNRQDF